MYIIVIEYLFIWGYYILDDESDTATEGEDEIKAREIRKQEVCLRIPDLSAATTDTGSDTEVIFLTPESVENNDKLLISEKNFNESLRNDGSRLNTTNSTRSSNIEESLNVLDSNSMTNGVSIDVNNSCASINSGSLCNNIQKTKFSVEKCDTLFSGLAMNGNKSNNSNSTSSSSLNNHNLYDKSITTEDSENDSNLKPQLLKTDLTEKSPTFSNISLTGNLASGLKTKYMCSSDNEHSSTITEPENDESSMDQTEKKNTGLCLNAVSIQDNCNLQLNNDTNDSNLKDNFSSSKSESKQIKLNVVTTEPYPKYTPTVEKAIKKYENKQPKKECIVM